MIVANAEAVEEITTRRKDFQKSEAMYKPLEVFGPNLDTVEGEMWQRHRRITTPPFNERNSALVWREQIAQARDMLQLWMSGSSAGGIATTDSDTMTLALHVLTAAGFGKSYSFAGRLATLAEGYSMTYKDALKLILKNMLIAIVISSAKLPARMLPWKILYVSEAIANSRSYMTEMVGEERLSMADGEGDKDNLMSVLVRAAELSKADEKARNSLTDDEIFGNLFIYNLAGHETTANTLAYALALMATKRDMQDWIGEEIEAVFGSEENVAPQHYEKAFPQLKRCLAMMYETLRLYGPVIFIPKYTNTAPQNLTINGREHKIPRKTCLRQLGGPSLHATILGTRLSGLAPPSGGSQPQPMRNARKSKTFSTLYPDRTCPGPTDPTSAQARNSPKLNLSPSSRIYYDVIRWSRFYSMKNHIQRPRNTSSNS